MSAAFVNGDPGVLTTTFGEQLAGLLAPAVAYIRQVDGFPSKDSLSALGIKLPNTFGITNETQPTITTNNDSTLGSSDPSQAQDFYAHAQRIIGSRSDNVQFMLFRPSGHALEALLSHKAQADELLRLSLPVAGYTGLAAIRCLQDPILARYYEAEPKKFVKCAEAVTHGTPLSDDTPSIEDLYLRYRMGRYLTHMHLPDSEDLPEDGIRPQDLMVLHKSFELEFFERYDSRLLSQMVALTNNPEVSKGKPLALIALGQADYSGTFIAPEIYSSLLAGYNVVAVEGRLDRALVNEIVKVDSMFDHQTAILLLGNHSNRLGIVLNQRGIGPGKLEMSDGPLLAQLRAVGTSDMTIVVDGCSTNEGGDFAQGEHAGNFARELERLSGHKVIAPIFDDFLFCFQFDPKAHVTNAIFYHDICDEEMLTQLRDSSDVPLQSGKLLELQNSFRITPNGGADQLSHSEMNILGQMFHTADKSLRYAFVVETNLGENFRLAETAVAAIDKVMLGSDQKFPVFVRNLTGPTGTESRIILALCHCSITNLDELKKSGSTSSR